MRARPWARRAALAGGAVTACGLLAGWFSCPRPWQQASGWNRIPASARPPVRSRLWPGEDAPRLHWLGHSGFLLEWGEARLLLDPNTSRWCTLARRSMEPAAAAASLGTIDAAVVSHAHFDHLDLPSLRRIPRLRSVVLPAGSEAYVASLASRGTRIVGVRPDEVLKIAGVEIVALPARHNGHRLHPLSSGHLALGYLLRRGTDSIYFAGDTGFGDHFLAIHQAYHPRVALLPIGAYAPRFPMAFYHLSPEEAVAAARLLGVQSVVPCHFGTFRLSLDRPDRALPRFAAAAAAAHLDWQMPRLLQRTASRPKRQAPLGEGAGR